MSDQPQLLHVPNTHKTLDVRALSDFEGSFVSQQSGPNEFEIA